MILKEAPSPLTDNIFFLATPENQKTENGKLWTSSITEQFKEFLKARSCELRKHGVLFVSVIVNNEPDLKPYQLKELKFYEGIA